MMNESKTFVKFITSLQKQMKAIGECKLSL